MIVITYQKLYKKNNNFDLCILLKLIKGIGEIKKKHEKAYMSYLLPTAPATQNIRTATANNKTVL